MRWWLPICVLPNGYVGDLVLVFIFVVIIILFLKFGQAQGSGDLSIGCGMFFMNISAQRPCFRQQIVCPLLGDLLHCFTTWRLSTLCTPIFKNNSFLFGTLDALHRNLQHMKIWYILQRYCNITKMVIPFQG